MVQMLAFFVALVATLPTETSAGALSVGAVSGGMALALCFLRLTTDMWWLWSGVGQFANWTCGCTLALGFFCAPDPGRFLVAAALGALVSWVLFIIWSVTEHFRERAQDWVRECVVPTQSREN